MDKHIFLPVPQEVKHPLFFSENDVRIAVNHQHPDSLDPVFSYEILYYNEILGAAFPWEAASHIKTMEVEWSGISEELKRAFTAREGKEINSLMIKAIAQFMMYLFWTNGMPAKPSLWMEELQGMSIKPVNAEERLGFVMIQPSLFHSYKQLNQLFIEQMKQYAKHMAIRKQR
jgi:hypothetical protein